MAIKFELDATDYVGQKHIGNALLAMAAERESNVGVVHKMTVKVEADTTDVVEKLEELNERTIGDVKLGAAAPDTTQSLDAPEPPHLDEEPASREDVPADDTPLPVTDTANVPWDERIHASTKTQNSNGTWKLRRKPKDMDKEDWEKYIDAVTLELVDGMPTPAADDTPPPPALDDNPADVFTGPVTEQAVTEQAVTEQAPPPPVLEESTREPEPVTFADLGKMITSAPGDKGQNMATVNDVLHGYGLEGKAPLQLVATSRQDLIPQAYNDIKAKLYEAADQ